MLFKALIKPSSDLGKVEIILRLTAIALLLRPTGPWSVRPVIIALAGLVIVSPKVMRALGPGLLWQGCWRLGSFGTGRFPTITFIGLVSMSGALTGFSRAKRRRKN